MPLKIERIPIEILLKLNEMGGIAESIKEIAKKIYPNKEIGKREIMEISRKLDILKEYNYIIKKRIGRNIFVKITNEGKKIIRLHPIFEYPAQT